MPPLARAWVRAGARQWNRMLTAKPGVLRDAFLADMALARELQSQPGLAHRTWSGAWLRTLDWLAQEGGAPGDQLGDYLRRVRGAMATGTLGALVCAHTRPADPRLVRTRLLRGPSAATPPCLILQTR